MKKYVKADIDDYSDDDLYNVQKFFRTIKIDISTLEQDFDDLDDYMKNNNITFDDDCYTDYYKHMKEIDPKLYNLWMDADLMFCLLNGTYTDPDWS